MKARLRLSVLAFVLGVCGGIVRSSSEVPHERFGRVRSMMRRARNTIFRRQTVKNEALYDAVDDSDTEAVRRLLDAGADANYASRGATVFHYAVYGGNVEIVRALLRNGADVHAKLVQPEGYRAQLPLSIAARRGNIDVMNELVRADARLDAIEDKGRTVFWHTFAAGRYSVVEYLLRGSEWAVMANASDLRRWLRGAIGTRDLVAIFGFESAPLSERFASVQLLLDMGAEVACEAENDCYNPCPLMDLLHYGKIVWLLCPRQEQFARYMEDVLALLMRAGADPAKKCYCLSMPCGPGRSQPESALEYVLNKSYDSSNAATVMALRGVPLPNDALQKHSRLRPYAAAYVRAATVWLDQQCPVDAVQRLILEILAGTHDMSQWLGLHYRAQLMSQIGASS